MFSEGKWDSGSSKRQMRLLPLAVCLLSLSLPGCSTVLDGVSGLFGPSVVGEEIDAHVVYRLRPGCSALMARTIQNGYTILSPREVPEIEGIDPLLGRDIEETGVFEGPVRAGEVVFRYIPPAASETWESGPIDVVADVDAIHLDLEAGHDRMTTLCGPLPGAPDPDVPRLPGQNL